MDFKDRVALVTGASSGIGRRLAVDLAARGATVVGCARSRERLAATAEELKRCGGSSEVLVCDVGDPDQVKGMIGDIIARFGRIDILVNNAGFGDYRSFAESSLESIEAMTRTNYLGTVYCTKAALPSMIARSTGHIVNISSVSGKIGTPNMAAYSATKFAQIGLSESLYHELKPHGIHVAVVCPGPVRTNFRRLYDARAPEPPAFMVLDAAAVSQAVIRAMERRKFEIILPKSLAFVCFLKGWMPGLVRFLISQAFRSAAARR